MLAATTKYGSYTSSSVEGRRISLNMLGTVDEIASEISRKTGISAVIDHNNRHVRFTEYVPEHDYRADDRAPDPRFFDSRKQHHEHHSAN